MLTGKPECFLALDRGLKGTPVKYSENILHSKSVLFKEKTFQSFIHLGKECLLHKRSGLALVGGSWKHLGNSQPSAVMEHLPSPIAYHYTRLQCSSGSQLKLLKVSEENFLRQPKTTMETETRTPEELETPGI